MVAKESKKDDRWFRGEKEEMKKLSMSEDVCMFGVVLYKKREGESLLNNTKYPRLDTEN